MIDSKLNAEIGCFFVLLFSVISPIIVQTIPGLSVVFWLNSFLVLIIFGLTTIFSKRFRKTVFSENFFWLLFIYLLVYLFAMLSTATDPHSKILKDFLRGGIILASLSLILYFCDDKNFKEKFILYFMKSVIFISCVAVVLSITKYYLQYAGVGLSSVYGINPLSVPIGSSLTKDYNAFSHTLLISLLYLFYFWTKNERPIKNIFLIIVIGCIVVVGLHSGSRRFLLLLPPIGIFLLLFYLFSVYFISRKTVNPSDQLRHFRYIAIKILISLITLLLVTIFLNHFYLGYQSVFYDGSASSLYKVRLETLAVGGENFGLKERTDRWQYALELFVDNPKLVFGDFNYRVLFGCKFINCEVEDYPHNAVLSGMLFGGLVGGLLTILIYTYPFWVSFKCLSLNVLFFVKVMVAISTTAFVLISGDNVFSMPVHLITLFFMMIYCPAGDKYPLRR